MAETLTWAGGVHLSAVIPALVLGCYVLLRRKGTRGHKVAGWLWVLLMLTVDVSAFFLQREGYSWIHLFAVINVTSILAGIVFIRNKKRIAHAACLVGAYLGTAAAGLGALAPGRYLNVVLFGAS